MDKRTLVREVVQMMERGDIAEAKAGAVRLREAGFIAGAFVGRVGMTPDQVIEWYAGQFLDIVDNESWFAMNSLCNCFDKFCPALARDAREGEEGGR